MEYISILKDDIDLNSSQRYLRLPHSRTGQPQLYLPYTTTDGREGICEVVKLNGNGRRTWFVGDNTVDVGSILVHHEIDPLFLIIPILLSLFPINTQSPPPFQPLSNLIGQASSNQTFSLPHPFISNPSKSSEGWNEDISRLMEIKPVRRILKLACERKILPPVPPSPPSESSSSIRNKNTVYYRPSLIKIISLLQKKVDYFSQPSHFGKFDHLVRPLGRDGLSGTNINEVLIKSARIKATCEHLSQWLPIKISTALSESYDFTALNTHLANITAASLAASAPDIQLSKSKTGTSLKRKAPPSSRGVESLKKVNTSSMAKMTSFFKPKEGGKR